MKNLEDFYHEVNAVINNPNICDRDIYAMVLAHDPEFERVSWDSDQIRGLSKDIWFAEKKKEIEKLTEGFNCQLVLDGDSIDFSFEFPTDYAEHALGIRLPKAWVGGGYFLAGWLEWDVDENSQYLEVCHRELGDPEEAYQMPDGRLEGNLIEKLWDLHMDEVLEALVDSLTPVYNRAIMPHMEAVRISEDLYYEQLECLPPLVQRGSYYCSSEPVTHVEDTPYYFQAWVKDGTTPNNRTFWGGIAPVNHFNPFL